MEEIQILELVERYLRDEMSQEERTRFEEIRRSNPEIDQLVVENMIFFGQVNNYGDLKTFKSTLSEVHNNLVHTGEIKETNGEAVIRQLWKRNKKVMASCIYCRAYYPAGCRKCFLCFQEGRQ